jgi:hypothetical protein
MTPSVVNDAHLKAHSKETLDEQREAANRSISKRIYGIFYAPLKEQDNYCVAWRPIPSVLPATPQKLTWSPELQKRAEQGDIASQNTLGLIYRNGYGIKENHTEAFKWFSKAASTGDNLAEGHLGELYEFGLGTKIDHKKAYYLLSLVTIQGFQWTKDWCRQAESNLSAKDAIDIRNKIKKWAKDWKPPSGPPSK